MIVSKKERLIVGTILGIFSCFLTYLFIENSVPHLGAFWRVLNIHLYLILLMSDPPSYLETLVSYLLFFIQWFFGGYLGKWLFERFVSKNQSFYREGKN